MPDIDGAALKQWIAEELEQVAALKKQLSNKQIDRLRMSDYSKKEIKDTLMEMENHQGLTKKYRSVYLTLRNWIEKKREIQKVKELNKGGKRNLNSRFTYDEALTYLERKGINFSQFEQQFTRHLDKNGKYYFTLKY